MWMIIAALVGIPLLALLVRMLFSRGFWLAVGVLMLTFVAYVLLYLVGYTFYSLFTH